MQYYYLVISAVGRVNVGLHVLSFCFYSYIVNAVPAVPGVCTITVLFNELSEMLLFIDSTWDSVPVSNMTFMSCILV